MGAKVAPWLLLGLALVPMAVLLVIAAFVGTSTADPDDFELPSYAEYYEWAIVPLGLFAAVVAPLLLCPDRRDGVLALYAARPITPLDYVGARWAAFLTVSLGAAWLPETLLFAWSALDASEPGSFLADNWDAVPRFLAAGALVATVLTTLSLLIASYAARRAYAAVAMLAVVFVGGAVGGIAQENFSGRIADLASLADVTAGARRRRALDLRRRASPTGRAGLGLDAVARRGLTAALAGLLLRRTQRWCAGERDGTQPPTIVVEGLSKWFARRRRRERRLARRRARRHGAARAERRRQDDPAPRDRRPDAPSQGAVRVFGEPVRGNPALYRRIGYMPEHESVYDFLTGRQFVELCARLQDVDDRGARSSGRSRPSISPPRPDRKLRGYSRGMRQRMRLAATLVHDPELLVLDEPLSGTDPAQRLHLRGVIRQLADEGRTILVSSHILEEVDQLADRIHLMVSGKLAASGDYRAIRQQLNDRPFVVRIDCSKPRALAAGLLEVEAIESVEIDDDGRLRVRSRDVTSLQRALPATAQRLDIRLSRVEPLDDSLESVFEYLATG